MLAELPHFNNARRYVVPLLMIGAIFTALGLGLTGAISAHANAFWRLDLPIPRALGFVGAAFLVAAAGFLSAAMVTFVRARLGARPHQPPMPAPAVPPTQTGEMPRWRKLLAAARVRAGAFWRVEMLAT